MRTLMTTAALSALLVAAPAAAQTSGTAAAEEDVYRNDLPETHDGFGLPKIEGAELAAVGSEGEQALQVVASGAVAAQQFGNVAAAKHASGAIRDLGDVMILLHSEINDRLDALGEMDEARPGSLPDSMSESARDRLDQLRDLNDREFDLGFATWVAEEYPYIIGAWRQLGRAEGMSELADAVVPRLEEQLAVAEQVVDADGDVRNLDAEFVQAMTAAAGAAPASSGDTGPTGAEGQTGERQHTPEPEPPAVQTGENYRHEQVEVDAQTRTEAVPGQAAEAGALAAGDLDVVNAAGLFLALENPDVELEQLRGAPELGADRVRIVPARQVLQSSEAEVVETTVAEREAEIAALRAALEVNQAISGAIDQAGATLDEVIALDMIDDGAVLYTWRQ